VAAHRQLSASRLSYRLRACVHAANSAHISCITPAGSLLRRTGWPSPMSVLWRILLLSASLAGGIPVDLRDTATGLDGLNTALLVSAIRHATGKRPGHYGYH
jgi:hypothetical protein